MTHASPEHEYDESVEEFEGEKPLSHFATRTAATSEGKSCKALVLQMVADEMVHASSRGRRELVPRLPGHAIAGTEGSEALQEVAMTRIQVEQLSTFFFNQRGATGASALAR
jgi:hypothetical protein